MLPLTSAWAAAITDEQVAARHGITVVEVQRLHSYRKLTNEALFEMSTERAGRVLWKLDNPRPDQPLGAAEFRQLQQTGGPDEPVPENALGEAMERLEAMRSAVPRTLQPRPGGPQPAPGAPAAARGPAPPLAYTVGGVPVGPVAAPTRPLARAPAGAAAGPGGPADPEAGILRLEIEPLPAAPAAPGPRGALAPAPGTAGLSPAGWKWLGPGNIGGRTRAILVHPTNPDIMWLASVAGGIWKTTDGGLSWGPLADFMANLNVSTLAMDPGSPDVLYAGTGEGFYNLDAFRGAGIFRSRDGGATWEQLPGTANTNFHFVNRLTITADGSALLAATRRGLFRSTNFGADDPAQVSFEPVAALAGRDLLDVDCHPAEATRCVAGGRGQTTYASTDGGTSWTLASGFPNIDPDETFDGRVELTFAVADPTVVYASVDNNLGELYRSNDGGQTFALRNTGAEYLSGQGWYDNAVWAGDPTNPDLVVVGGLDLHRSSNGGTTLTQTSEWWRAPLSAHADHHVIVAHPFYDGVSNRTVYFGNDGGIYRNEDILNATPTRGWLALNNGYGITQFYGAAANVWSGRVVGGTQDNGTLLYQPPPGPNTGPNGYSAMFGGDGGWSAADPTNPNFMYGEYVYLQVHRSVNGGLSANYIYNGIIDAGIRGRALFIAPFILDPADPNRMLAGGRSLWRSRNVKAATPSWEEIKGPIGTNLISAVDARRDAGAFGASNALGVGYVDGQVFRAINGTASQPTWTRVDGNGPAPLPDRYVTRVRIDPTDLDRVYVTFAGYQTDNLWHTTDGGATWDNLGADLPGVSVYDVAIHPANSNLLYAATEVGVFASEDRGETWWPTNQGPANVATQELFWMGEMLVSATHGRGIFWIDLSDAGVQVAAAAAAVAPAAGPAEAAGDAGATVSTEVVPTDPVNSR